MFDSRNVWDKSNLEFLKNLKLPSFYLGIFKIFKNVLEQLILDCPPKHVSTSTNCWLFCNFSEKTDNLFQDAKSGILEKRDPRPGNRHPPDDSRDEGPKNFLSLTQDPGPLKWDLAYLQHKHWSFQWNMFSVKATKSEGNCRFSHIYWRNLKWKTSLFVQWLINNLPGWGFRCYYKSFDSLLEN